MSQNYSYDTINILEIYNLILKKIDENIVLFDKEEFKSIFSELINDYKKIINKPKKSFFMKNEEEDKIKREKNKEIIEIENKFIKLLRDNLSDCDYI